MTKNQHKFPLVKACSNLLQLANVEVCAKFPQEGGVLPLYLVWEDGRKFGVDKVKSVERASARVGAILPVRFTCVIGGNEKWLYFEPTNNRWFVEKPV